MSYEPRGKLIDLIAAVRAEPDRLFTVKEAAALLVCSSNPSTVEAYIGAASRHGAIFRVNLRGEWLYAAQEITDAMVVASGRAPLDTSVVMTIPSAKYSDSEREQLQRDPRAPGPSGFVPKPMVPPRPGSDQSRAAPAAAPPPIRFTPAVPQERLDAINDSLVEKLARTVPAAPKPAPVEADASIAQDPAAEEAEEAVEFNAALWLDGDLVIYGAQELDDGGVLINREQLAKIRQLIAGSAP